MKVLVPVDGSVHSSNAVRYAVSFVKSNPSAEVTLLSVAANQPYFSETDSMLIVQEQMDNCIREHNEILETAKQILSDAGISVKSELLTGDPSSAIIHFVEQNRIDQIIMGSRGLSSLRRMIMGSVSYKVLANVRIPVTIVK